MKGYTDKREKRFKKRILLSVTDELHERIKSWATERGLTIAAAIRLLIREALIKEQQEREQKSL